MAVLKAFFHLILESAKLAVSWMGTTLLAVAVLAAPFFVRLIIAYRKEGWRGTKNSIGSASLYTVAVWSILFAVGMVCFIYQDHQRLSTANKKLREENIALQKPKTISQYAFGPDNEYAALSNTMHAFAILAHDPKLPDSHSHCQIKITAPKQNLEVAQMLSTLASAVGCTVTYPADVDFRPEALAEAENGAASGYIVVHARKDNPQAEAFTTMLSNVFSIKRSYSLPAASPSNIVWLQVGSDNIWRRY